MRTRRFAHSCLTQPQPPCATAHMDRQRRFFRLYCVFRLAGFFAPCVRAGCHTQSHIWFTNTAGYHTGLYLCNSPHTYCLTHIGHHTRVLYVQGVKLRAAAASSAGGAGALSKSWVESLLSAAGTGMCGFFVAWSCAVSSVGVQGLDHTASCRRSWHRHVQFRVQFPSHSAPIGPPPPPPVLMLFPYVLPCVAVARLW